MASFRYKQIQALSTQDSASKLNLTQEIVLSNTCTVEHGEQGPEVGTRELEGGAVRRHGCLWGIRGVGL